MRLDAEYVKIEIGIISWFTRFELLLVHCFVCHEPMHIEAIDFKPDATSTAALWIIKH